MTILVRAPVLSVVDERLRTTSLCVAVGYGSRDDPPGQGGLAHLLEHLIMSAPGSTGLSFSEHVERLGGRANAETGLERMLFHAQVHHEDADEVTGALLGAVERLDVDQRRWEAERSVVLQELAAAEADPADVVQDAFLTAIFPGHPLGRPVGGTPAEVRALAIDQVLAGHAERFRTSAAAIAVVGPRVPAALAGESILPSTGRPVGVGRAEIGMPPVKSAPPSWPGCFAWVCVGARSPRLGSPLRQAYPVLAQLLGASPSSLLYRRLRGELGLAYAFHAWDRGYTEAGAWRVLVGVEDGNGDHVVATVVDLLKDTATAGPTADDLDAARRQARMQLICEMESPLEHARLLAQRATSPTSRGSVDEELSELERVSVEQVRSAAAAVLDDLVTVVRPEVAP